MSVVIWFCDTAFLGHQPSAVGLVGLNLVLVAHSPGEGTLFKVSSPRGRGPRVVRRLGEICFYDQLPPAVMPPFTRQRGSLKANG